MEAVKKLIETVPKFRSYLSNPIVKRAEKKADLDKVSKGMNTVTRGFLGLLAENGRLSDLEKILSTFGVLIDADRGVVSATITTAAPLAAEQLETVKKDIKQRFLKGNQTLRLSTKIEPALLGGLQIQVGDKFVDLSVATEINQISQALSSE